MAREIPSAAWDGFSLRRRRDVPEGLWMRCPGCSQMLYRKAVAENFHVCPKCQQHFRVDARTRIEILVDPGSFEEHDQDFESADPLKFKDLKTYTEFKIGTGFKADLRQWIWDHRDLYKGRVVKYKSQPHGSKDRPRLPVFLGFRDAIDQS